MKLCYAQEQLHMYTDTPQAMENVQHNRDVVALINQSLTQNIRQSVI